MNKLTLLVLMFLAITSAIGQKLSVEATYEFESLKKDSYLGNVAYNPENKTTTLSYVEKDFFRTLRKEGVKAAFKKRRDLYG